MSATLLDEQVTNEDYTFLFDPKFISQKSLVRKIDDDADDDKPRIIEGYANVKVIDRIGDVIDPYSFEKSLSTYMMNPQLRFNHDEGSNIGKVLEIKMDDHGLWIKAEIGKTWDLANEKWEQIKFGSLKALSVMGRIMDWEQKKDKDGYMYNYITEFDLVEIAVVEIPMNQLSLFEVKSAKRLTKNRDKYLEVHKKLKYALLKNYQKRSKSMTENPEAIEAVVDKTTEEIAETKTLDETPATKVEKMEGDMEEEVAEEESTEPTEEEDLKTIAEFVNTIDAKIANIEERLSILENEKAAVEDESSEEKMEESSEEKMEEDDDEKSLNLATLKTMISDLMDEKLKNFKPGEEVETSVEEKKQPTDLRKSFRKTVSQHKSNVQQETKGLAAAIRERMRQ